MLFLRIAPFAALVAAAAVERAEMNEERGLEERGFCSSCHSGWHSSPLTRSLCYSRLHLWRCHVCL
jgi:hypothetical protein